MRKKGWTALLGIIQNQEVAQGKQAHPMTLGSCVPSQIFCIIMYN